MSALRRWISAATLMTLVASCAPSPGAGSKNALPTPLSDHPVISEIMAGAAGDNNHEFIELYNPGLEAIDLSGWQLVYRLPSSTNDLPVYAWEQSTLLPAHGHLLLVRQGEDVGRPPDAVFSQAINTSNGGLALVSPQGARVDSVGWGDAPASMTEGLPAQSLRNDESLERMPGADLGNGSDTQNNQADFAISTAPDPQNTGDPTAPALPQVVRISASGTPAVQPGQDVKLELQVDNTSQAAVSGLEAAAWIPDTFSPKDLPSDMTLDGNRLTWSVGPLEPGQSRSIAATFKAPWSQGDFGFLNPMAFSPQMARPAFGSPVWTTVQDGPIPIDVARSLLNQPVTVDGVSTIYTGALFAGSGNTKFYMSDASGGVQVWVPGGEFDLDVPIGANVRVHGTPQDYRGTVELVADSPDSVEVLGQENPPAPVDASVSQTQQEPAELAGQLIRVKGDLTQAIEETYSYNLTLANTQGESLNVYVDKQTELQVEGLTIDQPYTISGIFETPDGVPTLYPRIDADFERSYPKTLLVTLDVPASTPPDSPFVVTATVSNHTGRGLENVFVHTGAPESTRIIGIGANGTHTNDGLNWLVADLADGETRTVAYTARPTIRDGALDIPAFVAEATGATAGSSNGRVFVGDTVPIWAIQGSGPRSPYVLQSLTTQGVVTGVFPGLSGFWIQSTQTDGDPATSDGLFVNIGALRINVERGDLVDVTGRVRELSEQTQLELGSVSDVDIIRHGAVLPGPVELDPPDDDDAALAYNEAREGMLVGVQQPAVAVGPTSIYGEYTLVLAKYGVDRIMHGQPAGRRIVVDDGANTVHETREGLPYVVAVGDQVQGLVGPLAYTYGQHKIEPLTPPEVTPVNRSSSALAPTPADELRIMTWNAENLFDALPPHPSDPPPPTRSEYQRNLEKVAATIVAAGAPTIVALQEVENIDILKDLASLEVLAPFGYRAYLMEGTDSRGIDVGYLVRSDRARVRDERQLEVPEGLLSRPPLLIDVQLIGIDGLESITLINNHFTSLSGGIELTQPRRVAQAEINAQAAEDLLGSDPSAPVAVLGDLNSFYASPPLETLTETGFTDLFDHLPPDQRYSYIYQGVAQTLDHILVSSALDACLASFDVLHLDSPFPPPAPNDASAVGKSDHDPLVASFHCER
jgi:predicted extracellular nuclease